MLTNFHFFLRKNKKRYNIKFEYNIKTKFNKMKSYNLEGDDQAGRVLVGNWQEDRQWHENSHQIMKTGHGQSLTAQPGYENVRYNTAAQDYFPTPDVRHKKVPPRQALRERQEAQTIVRSLKTEELEAEDHDIHFTRGRYLNEPKLHEDLNLEYMREEPLTLYSEKNHHFGKDSHFTEPIQDYRGHEKVKDC
ncbi:hypothetical protein TRFO_14637 [Tritrichomonas foetus]|uniref:Uncharacterized protein n=1 Tax=Tritrichomonas foetus TaxID=1144522 RepID=A0A1J4KZF4_9EUKA|nr:hypothetical protein TRFO_14637 [Tritrichomonas foetus]|eukprot:OHT14973.1 hypothetical protein TRFO_14637 [Tritrichomonas foetus]